MVPVAWCFTQCTTPPLPAPSSDIFSKSSSALSSPSSRFWAKKNSRRFLCSSSTSEITRSSILVTRSPEGLTIGGIMAGGPITSPGCRGGGHTSSGLLQGRVRGRGGGFFDFFPLDIFPLPPSLTPSSTSQTLTRPLWVFFMASLALLRSFGSHRSLTGPTCPPGLTAYSYQ